MAPPFHYSLSKTASTKIGTAVTVVIFIGRRIEWRQKHFLLFQGYKQQPEASSTYIT
jgi:hypothetical protein